MGSIANYWFFWGLYLVSAVVFMVVFWRLTQFQQAVWKSYSLRAVAIVLIFTPWYSNPQESIMAPALMVATLDAITIGGIASFRSFVPLILALFVGLSVAGMLSFLKKKMTKKSNKYKEETSA